MKINQHTPPGTELDCIVAREVMGMEDWPGHPGKFKPRFVPANADPRPASPPDFSVSPVGAVHVLKRLSLLGFSYLISQVDDDAGASVMIVKRIKGENETNATAAELEHQTIGVETVGDVVEELPRGICIAAILAVRKFPPIFPPQQERKGLGLV